MFFTVAAYQLVPRAVGMPRAFRALAMPLNDLTPAALIAAITGSVFAANCSAS